MLRGGTGLKVCGQGRELIGTVGYVLGLYLFPGVTVYLTANVLVINLH